MVYIFDYIPVLEKFEWPLSLNKLSQKYGFKKNEKFSGYLVYFKYVTVIWLRLLHDLKVYQLLRNSRDKQIFPPGRTGSHTLTAEERDLMATTDAAQTGLEIDYESFLIFVNILLDKIAQIVSSILYEDKKTLIPAKSFYYHKKYFLDHSEEFLQGGNISRDIKERYVKLIIEKTEWFDMSLVLARDKLVAHGDKYSVGISTNAKGGIRIHKENIFGHFDNEAKQLIAIKKKYQARYSELKKVEDNLWEIMDFIMNYDIKLEKQDRGLFTNIVRLTGGPLPTLIFLANNTGNFIEEVAKTFGV